MSRLPTLCSRLGQARQAARYEYPQFDQFAEVTSLNAITFAVGNTTDRYTVEMLAYACSSMNEAAQALAGHQRALGLPDGGDMQAMLIEISFDDLESETERA